MGEQLELFDLNPYTVQPTNADEPEPERKVLILKTIEYQQLELNLFPEEPKADFADSLIRLAA
jgi:hypothetical protein